MESNSAAYEDPEPTWLDFEDQKNSPFLNSRQPPAGAIADISREDDDD